MNKILKKWKTPVCCVALAVIIFLCIFAVYPSLTTKSENKPQSYGKIIRVWHIDSFEGGKGSRASFLNSVGKLYEKEHCGNYILVTAHTEESARLAAEQGEIPDMISYGTGISFAADLAVPLEKYDFPMASSGGETYAYPWCRGEYFIFGTSDADFTDINEENTVVSDAGNFAETAAFCAGLRGDLIAEDSVKAYVDFINGKYKYMIGTQRDVWRLITRQFSFQAKPIDEFSELWQYISVCTRDPERYNICLDFIDCLLSETVQKRLSEIGMMSLTQKIYDSSVPALCAAEESIPLKSFSVFLSKDAAEDIRLYTKAALQGDKNGAKKLENYLL